MRVVYFYPAQRSDFQDALENARTGAPWFDAVVVAADSGRYHAFTDEQRRQLLAAGPNVVIRDHPFQDDHLEMYQHGADAAKELGADWLCFSDADEHFNAEFLWDVHKVCAGLEVHGKNIAGVNCHAQFSIADAVWPSSLSVDLPPDYVDLDKWPERVVVTNDHKHMLMKCYPDLTWGADGRLPKVHTTWFSPSHPWWLQDLPRTYWYLHRKTPLQVYASSSRNLYLCGGGPNCGDLNSMWVELKEITTGRLGIRTWPELEHYVQDERTTTYPDDLVRWMVRALTWKATDYGVESRQTALWLTYYRRELLDLPDMAYGVSHPPRPTEEDKVERFVQEKYVEVLARWPDLSGLEIYKKAILSGRLKQTELAGMLMASDEYREKFGEVRIPKRLPPS